jgi:hypothetical protein
LLRTNYFILLLRIISAWLTAMNGDNTSTNAEEWERYIPSKEEMRAWFIAAMLGGRQENLR